MDAVQYESLVMNRMATSADEFSRQLNDLAGRVQINMELVVRKAALDLFRRILKTSPVDTGRFKANNMIDVIHEHWETQVVAFGGSSSSNSRDAERHALEQAAQFEFQLHDGVIYIYNNLLAQGRGAAGGKGKDDPEESRLQKVRKR
jgi:predicted outer membrane protein